MSVKNDKLVDIIRICLTIDSMAYATYAKFAARCPDKVLARLWKICASEERTHVQFWRKALVLASKDELPQIFEDPDEIRSSLDLTVEKIRRALSEISSFEDPVQTLTMAYRLETFVLDTSLITMFHLFDSAVNSRIEKKYDSHVDRFIEMLRKYGGASSSHLDLLGESLGNLYRRNRELATQSSTDQLTGLLNRRGFFNGVRPFTNLAKRKKLKVGIVMGDIDDFKKINDSLGHPAGDKVLAAVASIISDSIRKSDIAARYGGEEFIVFTNIRDDDSLATICRRIVRNVQEKSARMAGTPVTISLGAAADRISGAEERDLSKIINRADDNLLKAKRNGKNRFEA